MFDILIINCFKIEVVEFLYGWESPRFVTILIYTYIQKISGKSSNRSNISIVGKIAITFNLLVIGFSTTKLLNNLNGSL